MSYRTRQCILMLLLLIVPTLLFAQVPFDDDVADVPIGGGLDVLVVAGIGYGMRRMKQYRKDVKKGDCSSPISIGCY